MKEPNEQKVEDADNLPLSWDELEQMKRKPVWIEFLGEDKKWRGEWCLLEEVHQIVIHILRCEINWFALKRMTMGKTWKAYRKENE